MGAAPSDGLIVLDPNWSVVWRSSSTGFLPIRTRWWARCAGDVRGAGGDRPRREGDRVRGGASPATSHGCDQNLAGSPGSGAEGVAQVSSRGGTRELASASARRANPRLRHDRTGRSVDVMELLVGESRERPLRLLPRPTLAFSCCRKRHFCYPGSMASRAPKKCSICRHCRACAACAYWSGCCASS